MNPRPAHRTTKRWQVVVTLLLVLVFSIAFTCLKHRAWRIQHPGAPEWTFWINP